MNLVKYTHSRKLWKQTKNKAGKNVIWLFLDLIKCFECVCVRRGPLKHPWRCERESKKCHESCFCNESLVIKKQVAVVLPNVTWGWRESLKSIIFLNEPQQCHQMSQGIINSFWSVTYYKNSLIIFYLSCTSWKTKIRIRSC